MNKLIIGSRGSVLALWQAEYIQKRLQDELGIFSDIQVVKTKGDKILDVPLSKIGGKGLFTKELEELLLDGEIDLAVHSLKDVPVDFIEGLGLACITQREDMRDCFLSQKYPSLESLPKKSKVGTTSLRRSMQLKAFRSDLDTQSLRGNVQTRLKRLDEGDFDAIILAQAGVNRLKISKKQIKYIVPLSEQVMIPAMGQGALGIEMRVNHPMYEEIKKLSDYPTSVCTQAERTFVRILEGGCQVPIGVNAQIQDKNITISAIVGLPDGSEILKNTIQGEVHKVESLVRELADYFIENNARELLNKAQNMVLDS
ncbi:hydroxymethylbilane synthase [Helicobacter cappadocius]|uniref:Porphobilinogen deaminase n=1 Tax=Helicobacter cappadocius TaxID=3063998 RepID=A0AA90Q3L0_9HELI|nr:MULTISPECIES: hydroxymethylbilane synthase [unclassified Helicobacter]MDO7253590.1 hydroxymethylbilane synthase [Helicobacter sp. faydin-H75]MDP2539518.1 hydroxymethylbilane synthase [Helicobacter sp. faydin-H76]